VRSASNPLCPVHDSCGAAHPRLPPTLLGPSVLWLLRVAARKGRRRRRGCTWLMTTTSWSGESFQECSSLSSSLMGASRPYSAPYSLSR
jgi:hypothetical protein